MSILIHVARLEELTSEVNNGDVDDRRPALWPIAALRSFLLLRGRKAALCVEYGSSDQIRKNGKLPFCKIVCETGRWGQGLLAAK